ncbi:Fanconi anemia group J protein homolog isoform X2 [Sipha flava]|uniref:Fanconi anemia group J protein homolog isoform X2 n=1 Tax=Sipha flava TaxID=143950 RepID=A0A8B8GJM9_9HEMI|nr:Fanconi anemia group J protein homolog isoform X2 [Sipha flava]
MSDPAVPPLYTYTIGGVKIEMPVKPYPSQVSMMDKVIRGCQKQQNCLLESPTGSGKTLALLCSALAWQRAERERLGKLIEEEFQQKILEWQLKEQQKKQLKEKQQKQQKTPEKKPAGTNISSAKSKGWSLVNDIDDDDSDEEMSIFKQPGKKRKMNRSHYFDNKNKSNDDSIMTNDSTDNSLMTEDEDENHITHQAESKIPKKPKLVVPVIFFCTRTHKQIEQVIKELQRTSFNHVRSCVLASRELTCIQDSNLFYPDITYKSKTELCRDLLDPKARFRNSLKFRRDIEKCVYHDNGGLKISTYSQLSNYGVSSVWDIEDIVKLGIEKRSCPYYGSRVLLKTAEIVFCPYNYVIDPVIRGTMNLQLKGHVIIVDEAHNIEDQCRSAASLRLEQTNLNLAKMDCEKLSKIGNNSTSYSAIAQYLSDMSKWIDQKSTEIKSFDDYDRGVISWSGMSTTASFNEFGIGSEAFEKFKKHCETVMADEGKENDEQDIGKDLMDGAKLDDTKTDKDESKVENLVKDNGFSQGNPYEDSITNATKNILTSIITVFCLLFDDDYKSDYQVSLERIMQMKKFEHADRNTSGIAGWLNSSQQSSESRTVWTNTVNFLCLNPAAVFHELTSTARCIILTSGTLSPMNSFQSELGSQFPITLEANHVIKPDQCWVTSVNGGPNRVDLNCQYQNTGTYGFQDEMGLVLKNVCETVPYGVLCFMPSYVLMDKLFARWQITGLLKDLKRTKAVMCEPRRGDQLEDLMTKYYAAVKRASAPGGRRGGLTGALFVAVYRGKISEGLDFSDNNARAVVAVSALCELRKSFAIIVMLSYRRHSVSQL